MGLDSYLYAKLSNGKAILIRSPLADGSNTWRRYSALHNHLESLWIAAGRPGARPAMPASKPTVEMTESGATIYVGRATDGTEFNQVEFKVTSEMLLSFFTANDSGFGVPNSVDYSNPDDYEDLSNAEFYRNWNIEVLKLARGYETKGLQLYYNSSW
jgi:hypothetical protein